MSLLDKLHAIFTLDGLFGSGRQHQHDLAEEQRRLYCVDGPYISMFNLDEDGVKRHQMLAHLYGPIEGEVVRPMTDDEMRKYASD